MIRLKIILDDRRIKPEIITTERGRYNDIELIKNIIYMLAMNDL